MATSRKKPAAPAHPAVPSAARGNTSCVDWHPADIKAALEKRGYSFRRIAREMGYGPKSCDAVLRRPMGPVEERVAEILGVPAAEIWPSRYVVPLRRLGRWPERRRRRTGPADRRSEPRPHNADCRTVRAA